MNIINYINASLEIWSCVFSIIIVICLVLSKQLRTNSGRLYMGMLLCNTGSQFFDVMALLLRGNTGMISWWGVRICNFTSYAFNYLLLVVFIEYLTAFLSERTEVSKHYLRIGRGICGISIIILSISQFAHIFYYFDEQNLYHRAQYFWISQICGIVCLVLCVMMLLRYGSSLMGIEKVGYWAYIIMPIAALIVQIYAYGLVLVNLANTISLTLIYLFLQANQGRREAEQQKQIAQQDNQLTQSRMAIMLSQIQPHFLYNALNTIHSLCRTQPEKAAKVVEDFSDYLRGNLDSLSQPEPIDIGKELKHLENYLSIEQLRFPDVEVCYDIKVDNFKLPALTIQPLVENAIRYGINTTKQRRGNVTISTWEEEQFFKLKITDDGVGFDPTEIQNDGRTHIGISNTRNRIEVMCQGTLEIESTKGKGTCILIQLPKEKNNERSISG